MADDGKQFECQVPPGITQEFVFNGVGDFVEPGSKDAQVYAVLLTNNGMQYGANLVLGLGGGERTTVAEGDRAVIIENGKATMSEGPVSQAVDLDKAIELQREVLERMGVSCTPLTDEAKNTVPSVRDLVPGLVR